MIPSIKQLKYIVAVAEHRHFGHAAAASFVTQSTLSAGVQDLEYALKITIFERNRKQILITEIGQDIILRAKRILQEVEDLIEASSLTSEPLVGKITLGAIPTIGPFMLPGLLAALRTSYPDLKIFLRESQTALLLEDLYAGRIDAALIALPYPMNGMKTVELFDDNFHLACLPDHAFAKLKLLDLKDLNAQPLLLLEEGHCLRQHALSACKLSSAHYGVPYQGTSMTTLVQMVANGIGVTLVPELAIKSGLLANINVIHKGFKDANVKRTIGLVWRPSSPKQQDLELLAEFITKYHK